MFLGMVGKKGVVSKDELLKKYLQDGQKGFIYIHYISTFIFLKSHFHAIKDHGEIMFIQGTSTFICSLFFSVLIYAAHSKILLSSDKTLKFRKGNRVPNMNTRGRDAGGPLLPAQKMSQTRVEKKFLLTPYMLYCRYFPSPHYVSNIKLVDFISGRFHPSGIRRFTASELSFFPVLQKAGIAHRHQQNNYHA